MKTKGYTLIEVLAVIVILAIIAVITVPLISGIIIKARKASYKDSAYGMIEAAKLYLAGNIDTIKEEDEIFFICDGKSCEYNGNKLYLKGPTPISGTIAITGKGETSLENVYNGKYYANQEPNEEVIITEEPADILSREELTKLIYDLLNRVEKKADKTTVTNLQNQHQSDIANLQNKINTLETKAIDIDKIYPVGSIYTTTNNVNPSTLFEGTSWERYGVGRTLLSTDATSGETGGSNTVTLTTANLPAHSHTVTANGSVSLTNTTHTHSVTAAGSVSSSFSNGVTSSSGLHNHTFTTGGYTLVIYANESYVALAKDKGYASSSPGWWTNVNKNIAEIAQSGNHTHTVTGSVTSTFKGSSVTSGNNNVTPTATFKGSNATTSSIGNGTSFSIQNPYITVYMWKRIS